jgi:hypothetical protein
MGSQVLYVLMQSLGTFAFAYLIGALAFKERRLYMVLVALGMYLIMGAALIEVGGERGGWTPFWLGTYLAMVSIGTVAIGMGSLLREGDDIDIPKRLEQSLWALLITAAVLGGGLAAMAGSSDSVVDDSALLGAEVSGGFRYLGIVGWVLGAPMFVGAVLVILAGARTSLVRGDGRGLWLWAAGVLFVIWPLDVHLGELTLAPTILLMAAATTYFGYQPKAESDEMDEKTEAIAEGHPGIVNDQGTAMEGPTEEPSDGTTNTPTGPSGSEDDATSEVEQPDKEG